MPEAIHSQTTSGGYAMRQPSAHGTTPIRREFVLELLRCMVELRLLRKARHAVMNFRRRWSKRNDVAKVLQAPSTRLLQNEAPLFFRPPGMSVS